MIFIIDFSVHFTTTKCYIIKLINSKFYFCILFILKGRTPRERKQEQGKQKSKCLEQKKRTCFLIKLNNKPQVYSSYTSSMRSIILNWTQNISFCRLLVSLRCDCTVHRLLSSYYPNSLSKKLSLGVSYYLQNFII